MRRDHRFAAWVMAMDDARVVEIVRVLNGSTPPVPGPGQSRYPAHAPTSIPTLLTTHGTRSPVVSSELACQHRFVEA